METRALAIACALIAQIGLSADQLKPRIDVDFGVGATQKPPPPPITFSAPGEQTKEQRESAAKARLNAAMARHSGQREAIDCKMVRPVDPAYRSAMPLVKPPADVKFAMKVIQAPPCPPHK